MRVAVLYSGGKDSNLALWRLRKAGHEIVALISAISDRPDSWMFHTPNIAYCRVQAECLGIPWIPVRVSGAKEAEVDELSDAIAQLRRSLDLDALGTGAIASQYQRTRVGHICSVLGISELAPLWGDGEEELLREMIGLGFEIYFSSVSAEGFDKDWLGSRLDADRISLLHRLREKYQINISGEGGEYETFVADMPMFGSRIVVLESKTSWHHNSGSWVIGKLMVLSKNPRL
ncbi:MAG: diphthine--ammonia ligase [Candidatus Methanomethylicus sp.]|nr:diphthine--ammonia ligase [Candidatus Methanomethylicus sp.]